MIFAGLTGGMACGKSFVATEFQRLGAHVIEADQLGHQVLLPDGEAYAQVVAQFGREILQANGEIDRAALARIVFPNPSALAQLNAIVHPAVRARALREAESSGAQVIIYAAAILIESGGAKDCAKVIVVSCTREQQLERALQRIDHANMNQPNQEALTQIEARLARQMPLEEKLAHADYTIDTSGTKLETLRQTKIVFDRLVELSKS